VIRLPHPRIALLAAVVLLAACQQLNPTEPGKPQAVTPQITDDSLRERARAQLAQGATQYQAGDYENAQKSLQSSLEHGLLAKNEQSRARKLLAFIHCVSNREQQCRDEFRKAFEIDPEFALTPAEDGHPIWGPVYRSVRTQLIAEREAAAASSKPFLPLAKAEQMMSDGLVKYDAGEFNDARDLLERALKEGLKQKSDQVKAMKFVAFTLCLQNHWSKCRAEFISIYDVDPNFDLTPAEAGHPSWTKTFASAKAHAKRALAAKEAKEAKERAAHPAAASKSR
jgi:tetratricopeptide (TPR) repeat protein